MSVTLYGESPGILWQPVSPRLAVARRVGALAGAVPTLAAAAVVAVLWTRWAWIAFGLLALGLVIELAIIGRQVSAISYAELPDEIIIRRGRLMRRLDSIPYGRLQYADMQSGPMERRLGLASVTIHTANPATSGNVPGLPLAEAEALRERLTARGEAQRAGL
ncbi:PH domain-containing protein [Nostocoides veronense]|uniref:PH domain-containing protein n=1 Tax=Nostocoides veronense TaxID=330836 RepID=A0ABN2L8N3_9MICO